MDQDQKRARIVSQSVKVGTICRTLGVTCVDELSERNIVLTKQALKKLLTGEEVNGSTRPFLVQHQCNSLHNVFTQVHRTDGQFKVPEIYMSQPGPGDMLQNGEVLPVAYHEISTAQMSTCTDLTLVPKDANKHSENIKKQKEYNCGYTGNDMHVDYSCKSVNLCVREQKQSFQHKSPLLFQAEVQGDIVESMTSSDGSKIKADLGILPESGQGLCCLPASIQTDEKSIHHNFGKIRKATMLEMDSHCKNTPHQFSQSGRSTTFPVGGDGAEKLHPASISSTNQEDMDDSFSSSASTRKTHKVHEKCSTVTYSRYGRPQRVKKETEKLKVSRDSKKSKNVSESKEGTKQTPRVFNNGSVEYNDITMPVTQLHNPTDIQQKLISLALQNNIDLTTVERMLKQDLNLSLAFHYESVTNDQDPSSLLLVRHHTSCPVHSWNLKCCSVRLKRL